MAEIIIMPKLGFNMDEGKLVEWYKSEGESVKKGEPLFSVETDKTNMDIEAVSDGVVKKLLIKAGDKVPVTLPIAVIGGENEDVQEQVASAKKELAAGTGGSVSVEEPQVEAPKEEKKVAVNATNSDTIIKISPRARRVARENGLDCSALNIVGTGWQGGICEKDILEYIESNHVKITGVAKAMADAEGIDISEINAGGPNARIMKKDIQNIIASSSSAQKNETDKDDLAAVPQYSSDGKEILEKTPYEGVRRIIGERLSQSKFTAPHIYFTQKVDLEELLKLRKKVNEVQEKKTSVTDYIARATVMALQRFPEMNSSLEGDTIVKYKSINLGIAVASPTGLIVPNIKNAQDKSVVDISKESSVLFDKARNGKLAIDEYNGGTFTISNLGMFGIENFTAIINPPEVGILAVSSTKDEPVVVTNADGEKQIAIHPVMNIQLTADHRVIDGLLAAQFVGEIKKILESPVSVLV